MGTTTDLTLQLQAVLADPDDDSACLAYADLLEEQGEAERAEFIRVQVEIARLHAAVQRWVRTPHDQPGGSAEDGGAAGTALAQAQNLECRELELWHATSPRGWAVGFEDVQSLFGVCHVLIPSDSLAFARPDPTRSPVLLVRRGFVEAITCTAADWLRHADALLTTHPVTEVTLTSLTDADLADLANRVEEDTAGCCDSPSRLARTGRELLRHLYPHIRTWHLALARLTPDPPAR
ncbi:MAG: TIGR02996 domain-containing protein [Gemmataceae bacterium]|nr:TIGR02996 domain-containing protein [Gemmataceae bacterium]